MENSALTAATGLLRAVANMKRLEILFHLRDQELNVGELQNLVGLSQSALSQHLAVLRDSKVVKTRREAQVIYYSICDPKVLKLLELLDVLFA